MARVEDLDEEAPAQVLYNPHSAYGKEMRKWEQFPSWYTPPGTNPGNPYVYRPYPKAMYMAFTHPKTGKPICMDVPPDPTMFADERSYARAFNDMEAWNAKCFKTVANEDEERIAKNEGWRNDPTEAIQRWWDVQKQAGVADAERQFRDQRMSPEAKAEALEYERSVSEMVPEIPSERERKRK